MKKSALLGTIMVLSFANILSSIPVLAGNCEECAGMHHDYYDKNAPQKINSENIVSFTLTLNEPQRYGMIIENPEYEGKEILAYTMSLERNGNGTLRIKAKGGNMYSSRRDGSAFIVDFTTKDQGYTSKLQELVKKYDLIKNNGYVSHTDGLPSGDGDTLSVVYDSGEKIYKRANNFRILQFEAAYEIYSLFRKMAVDNGLDFNTAGSNVQLYDDPTVEWLQGTWKGKHFGNEVVAIFRDNHLQIYYGGKLTDDSDYVIVDGEVKPAGKGAEEGKYVVFETVTSLTKKNSFSLCGHVYKNKSSSTFELLKQK